MYAKVMYADVSKYWDPLVRACMCKTIMITWKVVVRACIISVLSCS